MMVAVADSSAISVRFAKILAKFVSFTEGRVDMREHLVALTGRAHWIAKLLFVTTAMGCKAEEIVCAGVSTPGIQLQVRDAVTSADLAAVSTVVVRRTVGSSDSLVGKPVDAVKIAADVPNTYVLRVSAPGYATVMRSVVVPRSPDRCGSVVTQNVQIDLLREP